MLVNDTRVQPEFGYLLKNRQNFKNKEKLEEPFL